MTLYAKYAENRAQWKAGKSVSLLAKGTWNMYNFSKSFQGKILAAKFKPNSLVFTALSVCEYTSWHVVPLGDMSNCSLEQFVCLKTILTPLSYEKKFFTFQGNHQSSKEEGIPKSPLRLLSQTQRMKQFSGRNHTHPILLAQVRNMCAWFGSEMSG